MKFKMRSASLLSSNTLVKLYNQIYENYYLPLFHSMESMAHAIMVLDIDLEFSQVLFDREYPIGLALVGLRQDQAWLYCFGIVESYRGQGIGKKFLQNIMNRCSQLPVTQMGLEVLSQNAVARCIYQQAGFKTRCFLDAYTTLTPVKAEGAERVTIKPIKWEELIGLTGSDTSATPIVWSRRWNTLRKNKSLLLGVFRNHQLIGAITYRVHKAIIVDRLVVSKDTNLNAIGRALLRKVQCDNPHCIRINFMNISHLEKELIAFIEDLEMERFMRQHYLFKQF